MDLLWRILGGADKVAGMLLAPLPRWESDQTGPSPLLSLQLTRELCHWTPGRGLFPKELLVPQQKEGRPAARQAGVTGGGLKQRQRALRLPPEIAACPQGQPSAEHPRSKLLRTEPDAHLLT